MTSGAWQGVSLDSFSFWPDICPLTDQFIASPAHYSTLDRQTGLQYNVPVTVTEVALVTQLQ